MLMENFSRSNLSSFDLFFPFSQQQTKDEGNLEFTSRERASQLGKNTVEQQ
jgi:hypothetical protein